MIPLAFGLPQYQSFPDVHWQNNPGLGYKPQYQPYPIETQQEMFMDSYQLPLNSQWQNNWDQMNNYGQVPPYPGQWNQFQPSYYPPSFNQDIGFGPRPIGQNIDLDSIQSVMVTPAEGHWAGRVPY